MSFSYVFLYVYYVSYNYVVQKETRARRYDSTKERKHDRTTGMRRREMGRSMPLHVSRVGRKYINAGIYQEIEKRFGIVRPNNHWESTVYVSFGISANTINDNQ